MRTVKLLKENPFRYPSGCRHFSSCVTWSEFDETWQRANEADHTWHITFAKSSTKREMMSQMHHAFTTFQNHMLIVRLDQSTIRVSRDVHCHSSPLYHLPGELVSLRSIPMPSIDLNLWNLSRPIPMSLGFTSFLTDDIDKSFRKTNLE